MVSFLAFHKNDAVTSGSAGPQGYTQRKTQKMAQGRRRLLPEWLPKLFLSEDKFRTLTPMLAYMAAYLVSFSLIEQWNRLHYTVIHTAMDDRIPFVPVFVIPYLLWFPYVSGFAFFLLHKHEESYHRLCSCLVIGMTIFIAVSVVFPNIHMLRPETMPADNAFTRAVGLLYLVDTPTNLTPSIHVFNSLAVMAAAWNWNWKTDDGHAAGAPLRTFWRAAISLLGFLIILSTMLIKQHSFSDVAVAVVLFVIVWVLVYRFDFVLLGVRHSRRRPVMVPVRTSFR